MTDTHGGVALRALAVVLLAVGLAGCPGAPGTEHGEAGAAGNGGESAPDFALQALGGEEVRLADLRGKTVIIDFWATWCPPCEFQVPELNAFYEEHAAAGDVEVLGISVDTEGPDVVGKWVAEKQVRYPILLGSDDLARRYGAVGFPTLVIVAPDGSVDSRHVGLIERAELEKALESQRAAARAGPSAPST